MEKNYSVMESEMIDYKKLTLKKLLELAEVSYIGSCTHSAKLVYSKNNNCLTYGIYLMPADGASFINESGDKVTLNVCPNHKWCKAFCLNQSGHNKAQLMHNNNEYSFIEDSRIKKTRLFYFNPSLFMEIVIREIRKYEKFAKKNGYDFAVRLNCTSDLNPEQFYYEGKNILQIFPHIQFYDYTKVANRLPLQFKYKNYDLTYSYNGYNWKTCKKYLEQGGKVAVVFRDKLPKLFDNFNVIDANGYDMRFLDPSSTIMGLHYHRTANDYVNGEYKKRKSNFIVESDDERCYYI